MRIVVGNGQSLFDIAAYYTGDSWRALDIALENDLQLDEELVAGSELGYSGEVNAKVVKYMGWGPEPATQLTALQAHVRLFDFVFDKVFE